MNFGRPEILGIVFGVLIVVLFVRSEGLAVGRLLFVVVAWWLAFEYTEADKYWLTGALAVTYTAPLLVQLKQLIFPKR